MLYTVDSNKYIRDIPHEDDFKRWRSRLSEPEAAAIAAAIDDLVEKAPPGKQILTSSWIPGSDWAGTVFEPIYEKACEGDSEAAARCFGLFVWVALQRRPEVFGFGRYEKDGMPIRGMTYFVLENPPPQ